MISPLAALFLLPALASAPADAPVLSIEDLSFGTVAPDAVTGSDHLGLVPGHTVRLRVTSGPASAGGVALFGAAGGLTGTPLPLGLGQILLDPASLVVLGSSPLDAQGAGALDLTVPPGLIPGTLAATQAVTIDATLSLRTTDALALAVTDLTPVVLENFNQSMHPASGTKTALVLTDAAALQAFYIQHLGPSAPVPAVDFTKDVVVVGFGGHYLTYGYTVVVDGLAALPGGGLEVRQTILTPGLGCGTLFSESRPGQVVTVDRVAGASLVVTLTQEVQGAPCP